MNKKKPKRDLNMQVNKFKSAVGRQDTNAQRSKKQTSKDYADMMMKKLGLE